MEILHKAADLISVSFSIFRNFPSLSLSFANGYNIKVLSGLI
jgi:hypothetical protein